MRVTIPILLALSALALGKIERVPMPANMCKIYRNLGTEYKKTGNTKTQHEIQDLGLKQYLWETDRTRPSKKIPDATVKYIESLDREIYNAASQQGRKKRQAGWYRGERKEIRMLSDEERRAVFNCFNTLKQTKTLEPNVYDALASVHHGATTPVARFGCGFLGFHRIYLLRLELAMRQYCGPTITIPYWATTLDDPLQDPALSVVWSPEFFGNAYNFVETGPFANWTDRSGRRISRNLNNIGSLINERDIEQVIERNKHYHDIFYRPENPSAANLVNTIEGIQNNPHGFVGGTMNRMNIASYDPLFFFYHAFVDYIFEKARESFRNRGFNPANDYPECVGDHAAQSPMASYTFFRNIDGLNDIWTNQYFYYTDPPTCSALNRDCGSKYLVCRNTRGQWKCQSRVTNSVFDVSPEIRMASYALNEQLPGQRFQVTRGNVNTGLTGNINTGLTGSINTGLTGPTDQLGGTVQQNPWNLAGPKVELPVSPPQTSGASPFTESQMGTNVAQQFGAGGNTLSQQAQPDPLPRQIGIGQPQNIPGFQTSVLSETGTSQFGSQMVHSLPVQPSPVQSLSVQLPVQSQPPQGNLHTGVHSAFNPFDPKNQQQGMNGAGNGNMELPVMGSPGGGMELPVMNPVVDPVNTFEPIGNPMEQIGPNPQVSGPELQVRNPQTVAQSPPVVNPAPAKSPVDIGPKPIPITPPPKPTNPPQPVQPLEPRPQPPSIISNLNLPGNQQGGSGNFFSWRTQPQNSFSMRRQKRSVKQDLPLPLDNERTSWVHQLAYPIQNTFEIDGVADSSKWLYVPVSVTVVRSPNRTFEIHGYENSMNSPYDIYDPIQSRQFQRRLTTQALPKRSHSSISGSGASQIYLKSDGLSYDGTYMDYVIVDERLPISEYTGFVAIKDPKYGKSDTHVSVFDSLGQICKPRCATSKSRSNPKYRPCSGVIEAVTSSPDMAYKSIPEAIMDMWAVRDPYPPRMYRPTYLEFLCDSTNTLYWEGCQNDRYQ
ncbi:uncharacterized protein LOC133173779 [Saccostrea echinata]|uniref:uncharacterized protein LOC133173779 n=1 Tax=Saccostrea echinata TaxID=191078 RepID=UPI002A81C00E|nr:uncharacterized protein LOC133173779 [Saccostrea echinata]